MTTAVFQVNGMTCSHCERAISEEVRRLPHVEGVEVSAATGRLVITSDGTVSDEEVLAAVDEAGYSAARTA